MIIRSIRLLNIKSFGSGSDGQGILVSFERGLNRISGRNGAGKSTLIEAMGFVLFDCPPAAGHRLDLDTALLRHGCKEGEIEARIETGDGLYSVRRGVGKHSKIRWTVRDETGFVTHETEPEVRSFLASAAGVPGADGLADLFRKLLGVRQGKLIDPFEASPGEARKHFAPILDVDIYQHCFVALAEPANELRAYFERANADARVARAKTEYLAHVPKLVEDLRGRMQKWLPELERRKEFMTEARDALARADLAERTLTQTALRLEAAIKTVQSADAALLGKRELLARAQQAQSVIEATKGAHEAYEAAQKVATEIVEKRKIFEQLRRRMEALSKEHARHDARAQEAEKRTRELLDDLEQHSAKLMARESAVAGQRANLLAQQDQSAQGELEPELQKAWETLESWSSALAAVVPSTRNAGQQALNAARELADFDPDRIQYARATVEVARKDHESVRDRFTTAAANRDTKRRLAKELEDTRRCPILLEHCKQFQSSHLLLSDVKLDQSMEEVRNELFIAESARKQAERMAAEAEQEVAGTQIARAQVDVALNEIGRSVDLACGNHHRNAFRAMAAHLEPPPETATALLPDPPNLPDPGEDPWQALSAAPQAAAEFCAYADRIEESMTRWKSALEKRKQLAQELRENLNLRRQEIKMAEEGLEEQRRDVAARHAEYEKQKNQALEAAKTAEDMAKSLDDLKDSVSGLVTLEEESERAQQALKEHAEGHRAHLAASADAGRLEQARAETAVTANELEIARTQAARARQEKDSALSSYSPEEHDKTRLRLQQTIREVGALEKELDRDRGELTHAEKRLEELQKAQADLRDCEARRDLLEARRKVLEHARRTLRDVGPRVADQLVKAVTLRAQSIYSALSPLDPGQLEWRADYELRVATSSGVRRFATLSGGQKVKAALAVQLALVQQFSRTGLCIFDEPTYALDIESRALLAEAINDAQEVSGFEQLFIVSHDDAFDGHVEHTVHLEYSPASGTAVLEM